MNTTEWIYVIAIGLQLAGAVLLIIKYWRKKLQKQIDELWSKQNHVSEKGFHIGNAAPTNKEHAHEVILSRIAFIYLAAGYLLGVCGERGQVLRDSILVVVFPLCFIMIGKWVAKKQSQKYDVN